MADGFLFSAGTDTQIIAYEAVKYKPDIPCLTLAFKHGKPKDTEYVKRMVELLHLKQETYQFGKEDVMKYYPKVVEALKKFDPMEIRNSLPVYIGLTLFKPKGIKTVFTGDALDELFGYPWQFHLSEAEFAKKQEEMWAEMGFSSFPMAESLGMEIKAPYRDPEFMDWAMKLPIKYKINMYNGVKYSKWILRKAYEDVIPKDVIWRPKAPLEAGNRNRNSEDILQRHDNREGIRGEESSNQRRQTTLKSKTKSNYSTTKSSARNSANPKTCSPRSKAPSNVPNATATSKPKYSSAKPAELTPSKFFFYFFQIPKARVIFA